MDHPIDRLVALFHRRWAAPVLAELAADDGAKFVTLARRLGSAPPVLRATLEALIEQGWIERNPGHGHPMRPEYLLTGEGRALAPPTLRLVRTVHRMHLEPLAFRKWTMPVTYVLGDEPLRFNELGTRLPGITPRALIRALKDMQASDLLRRDVLHDYPPVTSYRLERRARPIVRDLAHVARAV